MAMFSKRAAESPDPQPVGYSVFDAQMSVDGDVDTDGSLRIDGRVRGNVRSAGVVVVAAGASVTGDVSAREVIVGGTIAGNITATQRVELQESAAITGDVEASAIMIQEGGRVDGRMTIHPTTGNPTDAGRAVTAGAPRYQPAFGDETG